MYKILKNTTESTIVLDKLAVEIPASSQYQVPQQKYLLLATDDVIAELTTYINSGDIVVNDGTNDLISSAGISFLKYPDTAANIAFEPTVDITATTVQAAIGSGVNTALNTPRYSIPLIYNGTLGNNEFIGYSNLLSGDSTPIIIPVNSLLKEYTFSNTNLASFSIELRRNSTTATVFNTATKVDEKAFVQTEINEAFSQGDAIYIKYIDQGTNAQDAGIILIFQAVP